MLEPWQHTWRNGIAPLLSGESLRRLRLALVEDDPTLCQGATTQPPPLIAMFDYHVEAACAIGYCGWKGEELDTVRDVDQFFSRMCFEIDGRLGEPAGYRHFTSWFDGTPRERMIPLLLAEVDLALKERADGPAGQTDHGVDR